MGLWTGTLRAFDSGTYTATIELRGSKGVPTTAIPVSRGIASAELVAGRIVVLAVVDPSTTAGMMVLGVH